MAFRGSYGCNLSMVQQSPTDPSRVARPPSLHCNFACSWLTHDIRWKVAPINQNCGFWEWELMNVLVHDAVQAQFPFDISNSVFVEDAATMQQSSSAAQLQL